MSTPDKVALSAAIQAVVNEGYDPDEAQVIATAAVAAYQQKMLEMMETDANGTAGADRSPVPPTAAQAWSAEDDSDEDGA